MLEIDLEAMGRHAKAALTETTSVEPLTDIELAVASLVARWQDEQTQRLEREFARIIAAAKERLKPILAAHRLASNDEWDLRPDPLSKNGYSLGVKRANPDASGPKPTPPTADVLKIEAAASRRATRGAKRAKGVKDVKAVPPRRGKS